MKIRSSIPLATTALLLTCSVSGFSSSLHHSDGNRSGVWLKKPNGRGRRRPPSSPAVVVSLLFNDRRVRSGGGSASSLLKLTSDASASSSATEDSDDKKKQKLDVDAIKKYAVALVTQMSLFYIIFSGFDKVVAATNFKVPNALNFVLFYLCALKSRILNPLSNVRPQRRNLEIDDNAPKRILPSFTPPGFVFPIMW